MSSRYRRLIKVSVLVSPIFSVNHLQQSGGAINFCSASHHSVDNEISNRRIWTNDFIIRGTQQYHKCQVGLLLIWLMVYCLSSIPPLMRFKAQIIVG
ncbi:uncharacterized protein LOC110649856 isoform X4 [Hevea brasiliensis]|uniref:uncharacterized protein LOC110649856 isoform X4 n=1 Tax=Hevea brasiliensis TaxID=3981 RepID=UPI0025D89832|nr:uncharacterized protein LOC110649856 isoform X4 [Hevea brasiliensis]